MPKIKSTGLGMSMPMGAGPSASSPMSPDMGMPMDEGMVDVGMEMPRMKKAVKSSYKKPKSPAVKYPKKGSAKTVKKNTIKGFKSRRSK